MNFFQICLYTTGVLNPQSSAYWELGSATAGKDKKLHLHKQRVCTCKTILSTVQLAYAAKETSTRSLTHPLPAAAAASPQSRKGWGPLIYNNESPKAIIQHF